MPYLSYQLIRCWHCQVARKDNHLTDDEEHICSLYPQLLSTIRFYLINKYITVVVIGPVDKWITFANNLVDVTFMYTCASLPRGFHGL